MPAVHLHQRTLRTRRAFDQGQRQFDERRSLLLHIDDGSIQAFGEACPLPAFAGEDYDSCLQTLQDARDKLEQQFDHELRIDQRFPCAAFALETALHDYQAQQAGLPLARWLHADAADYCQVQSLLGSNDDTVPGTAVKCKIGGLPIAEERQRLQHISRTLPGGTRLRLDAGGQYSLETALELSKALADISIDYIEDPCASLADMRQFAAASRLPLAIDQTLHQAATRDAARQADFCQVFIVKPMCFGSWQDINAFCAATKQRVVISDFHNGSVARCAARHIAAAIDPAADEWHGLAGDDLFSNDYQQLRLTDDQHFLISSLPGLGITACPT